MLQTPRKEDSHTDRNAGEDREKSPYPMLGVFGQIDRPFRPPGPGHGALHVPSVLLVRILALLLAFRLPAPRPTPISSLLCSALHSSTPGPFSWAIDSESLMATKLHSPDNLSAHSKCHWRFRCCICMTPVCLDTNIELHRGCSRNDFLSRRPPSGPFEANPPLPSVYVSLELAPRAI